MVEKGVNYKPKPVGNGRTPSPPQGYFKPAPAEIRYGNLRFLITDRPTDFTMVQFIEVSHSLVTHSSHEVTQAPGLFTRFFSQELKKHQANDVVRVCEPSYKTDLLEKEKITVHVSALLELFSLC